MILKKKLYKNKGISLVPMSLYFVDKKGEKLWQWRFKTKHQLNIGVLAYPKRASLVLENLSNKIWEGNITI